MPKASAFVRSRSSSIPSLRRGTKLGAALLPALLALAGCPGNQDTDGGIIGDGGLLATCGDSSECPSGFVCSGGSCVVGECLDSLVGLCREQNPPPDDIAPYCCKPWQLCDFTNRCVPDPDAVVGGQCEVSEDCPNPGQFCSGGTCYDAAGRTPCTASFQCAADERCDRTVFLCVPDIGGCELCTSFPELCCEAAQLCDEETGFCIDIDDIECDTDDDCRPGTVCDTFGRCVQCETDDDCGPGTSCNEGTGDCYSTTFACETDDDCDPPRLCAPASDECVNPQCVTDSMCNTGSGPTQACDLNTYTCYLPAAQCTESDEPNNDQGSATPITGGAISGTLCRGDSDYLSFPIEGDRRYRVTVTFTDYNNNGIEIALVRPGGGLIDSRTFSFSDDATVVAITDPDETGELYLRIASGAADDRDLWSYTVTIEDSPAPQVVSCDDEIAQGIEPNDDFDDAYPVAAGAYVFARCDDGDEDFYRIELPPQTGLEVTIEFIDDDGDLDMRLYDGPTTADEIDSSTSVSDVERVEAPEGGSTYWLKVYKVGSGVDGQSYTMTVTPVSRPAVCAADPDEPENDSFATAPLASTNTTEEHLLCVPIDVDVHRVDLPANYGGELRVEFNHADGDIRVDLYDADETLVTSSNTSGPGLGQEVVALPFAATPSTYYARVRLHTNSGIVGLPYTLSVSTYDATTCIASEPVPNGTATESTCVGALTSPFPCAGPVLPLPLDGPSLATCDGAPETVGCGTLCGGTDEDFYRVGTLNDGQLLYARVQYDPGDADAGPSPGGLALALARANTQLSAVSYVEYTSDLAGTGSLELYLTAPTVDPAFAREYIVIVKPDGEGAYAALPYTLDVSVGPPCPVDGMEPNNNPSQSTRVRQQGAPGVPFQEDTAATLCAADTDVYEIFLFNAETLTATLSGPLGATVDIGERPAVITDPAPTLPGGAGASVVGPCPLNVLEESDGGVVDTGSAGEACVQATHTAAGVEQLFITVRREADGPGTLGPYGLRIDVQ